MASVNWPTVITRWMARVAARTRTNPVSNAEASSTIGWTRAWSSPASSAACSPASLSRCNHHDGGAGIGDEAAQGRRHQVLQGLHVGSETDLQIAKPGLGIVMEGERKALHVREERTA